MALSLGFMLLFTPFFTAQNLASQVLEDNNFGKLGFYSLGLLYCVFGISCFVSLPIVKKLGARNSQTLGAFCFTFYVAAFVLPAFRSENPNSESWLLNRTLIQVVIMIGASINGFGAALIWVG